MPETVKLEVATPNGLALETDTEIVTAPSVVGEFGVLPGHLPLLAATKAGVLRFRVNGKDEAAAVGPGFVEAGPNKVLLLTDAFKAEGTIDKAEAEKALADAEKAIATFEGGPNHSDYEELLRDQAWARAQLDVVTGA